MSDDEQVRSGRRAVLRTGAAALALGAAGTAHGLSEEGRRVTPERSGAVQATPGPGPSPPVRWSENYDDGPVRMTARGEHLLLQAGGDLRAVDLVTGAVRWARDGATSPNAWLLSLSDGIYVVDDWTVAALDPGDGTERWSTVLDDGPVSWEHVGDRLVVGGRQGHWYVLDDADGAVVRRGHLDGSWARPVGLRDGTLYLSALDAGLRAYDLSDGGVRWHLDRAVRIPVLEGDWLYVGTDETELLRVDPGDGRVDWTYEGEAFQYSAVVPAFEAGRLFAVSAGHLARVDRENGREAWSYSEKAVYAPRPTAVDGGRVFTSVGGNVVALDVETGETDWDQYTRAFETTLAYGDGTLYVGAAGEVRAFDSGGERRWTHRLDGPHGDRDAPGLVLREDTLVARNGTAVAALDRNSPPSATIEQAPEFLPVGETATFVAGATDPESDPDDLTYVWEFGDGWEAASRSYDHAYEEEGTYEVTLAVEDGMGGRDTASTTVRVGTTPTPTPTPTPSTVPGLGLAAASAGLAGVVAWLARRR